MDALERAIKFFGSQEELASAVGLTTAMAVTQWRKRGVPPKRCVQIQFATNGAVKASELRPDIFGGTIERDTTVSK